MSNFRLIVVFIGTAVLVVSFILAFMLRKKKGLPEYFKFFYWIPLAALMVSLNGIIGIQYQQFTKPVYNALQHLFFLAEFSITCLVFNVIFDRKNKLIAIIFFITILSFGVLLWTNGLYKESFQLYAFPCFATFILCMYYYYQLFDDEEKPIFNLLKNPSFWIVTGLFFFSCITLPLFAILEYFYYKFGYRAAVYLLSFANLFIIIKHLFFIKAYRCAAKSNAERKTT